MQDKIVSIPELALIGGTRAILGAGIGLLLADRLNTEERRAVGWALTAVGALTTIPLAAELFFGNSKVAAQPIRQHTRQRTHATN